MSILIAKRYVKALLDGKEAKEVKTLAKELNEIASAYGDEKFKAILSAIDVTTKEKEDLLISFVKKCSKPTENLIKLLGANGRLDILKTISNELDKELADLTNTYTGVIYTNKKLAASYVKSLEEKFSSKFDVSLKLAQNVCDYDGIKVDIDGLGLEVGFSKDRLKSQLKDYILKAV